MALGLAAVTGLAGCGYEIPPEKRIIGGDPERGKLVISAVGCGLCHIVPGVPGPRGTVGPSLEAFGGRALIAGVVPNRPAILTQWVRNAPSLVPETGMPDLPLTDQQARDVAAYLYTLR